MCYKIANSPHLFLVGFRPRLQVAISVRVRHSPMPGLEVVTLGVEADSRRPLANGLDSSIGRSHRAQLGEVLLLTTEAAFDENPDVTEGDEDCPRDEESVQDVG